VTALFIFKVTTRDIYELVC